jgi:hypothetical protein
MDQQATGCQTYVKRRAGGCESIGGWPDMAWRVHVYEVRRAGVGKAASLHTQRAHGQPTRALQHSRRPALLLHAECASCRTYARPYPGLLCPPVHSVLNHCCRLDHALPGRERPAGCDVEGRLPFFAASHHIAAHRSVPARYAAPPAHLTANNGRRRLLVRALPRCPSRRNLLTAAGVETRTHWCCPPSRTIPPRFLSRE